MTNRNKYSSLGRLVIYGVCHQDNGWDTSENTEKGEARIQEAPLADEVEDAAEGIKEVPLKTEDATCAHGLKRLEGKVT